MQKNKAGWQKRKAEIVKAEINPGSTRALAYFAELIPFRHQQDGVRPARHFAASIRANS